MSGKVWNGSDSCVGRLCGHLKIQGNLGLESKSGRSSSEAKTKLTCVCVYRYIYVHIYIYIHIYDNNKQTYY